MIKDGRQGAEAQGKDPAQARVRHEIYSILLIERMFRDIYRGTVNNLPKFDVRDVIAIINPAIPPSENSPLLKVGAYPLVRELISGELDIDRDGLVVGQIIAR